MARIQFLYNFAATARFALSPEYEEADGEAEDRDEDQGSRSSAIRFPNVQALSFLGHYQQRTLHEDPYFPSVRVRVNEIVSEKAVDSRSVSVARNLRDLFFRSAPDWS